MLTDDRPIVVGSSGRRLIALLATRREPVTRKQASRFLWPDRADARAAARLRVTLCRVRSACPGLLSESDELRFADDVWVDLWSARGLAQRLLHTSCVWNLVGLLRQPRCADSSLSLLGHDLLPDWPEPWLCGVRERFRQLRLHALERLSAAFCAIQRPHEAARVVGLAVTAEPHRESARRVFARALSLAMGDMLMRTGPCDARSLGQPASEPTGAPSAIWACPGDGDPR
ncbi:AfsR/SARP family transcriptional regulator [Protofrankia symbiont of Coriaria ruscifolia]|uniref:AfsR/SARP family transcriptional regulator n=1 Tax=Protofrankia symbiont of Coriaria ruscifolia TaxID=1306542 RepID=UPI0013EF71E6|nr:bacterial transcriptional activator domain-containing protein [Protofrankia symbiont of Coriaria ruscifolia]